MSETKGLLSQLEEYAQSDFYPCHMPGHKRRLAAMLAPKQRGSAAQDGGLSAEERILTEAAGLDITEIDGFDNLHEPEGVLKEAMERAARLYGADQTFYSVNGSTAGLLTAISAAVPEGEKLLMARNCHKAVYHAVYLRRIQPVYLYPETFQEPAIADVVTPRQVEEALRRNPDARALLVTSPTYDGVVADIAGIAAAAHRYSVPLIVDAAHGAHFGFHPAFPDSPVRQGADLTVVSLHKTMPCMTQTALLHVCGNRVDRNRLRLFEGIYQSSSPSYFLMAGMDTCIRLVEEQKAALWNSFWEDRESFLEKTNDLQGIRVYTAGHMPQQTVKNKDSDAGRYVDARPDKWMDPGKILIDASRRHLTGRQLYDILLNQYHLQMEMAAGSYVTAIMTCCDEKEGWERLADALCELDEQKPALQSGEERKEQGADSGLEAKAKGLTLAKEDWAVRYPALEAGCSLTDALDAVTEQVTLEESAGRISGAFLNLYPPGIPLVVPGERFEESIIAQLLRCRQQGLPVIGMAKDAVTVVKELP